MNKLSYGNFDISNGDIAFSATNGYSEPSSELERRKQLSYPLKEVKTFVNNTVPVLKSGSDETTAIQLVVESNKLKYRSQAGGDLTEVSSIALTDVYPVGSIYLSVNNTNPSTLFGGTWTQINNASLLDSEVKIESLWTNENPTSTFSSQTVSIDLTNYDLIFICHYGNYTESGPYPQYVVTAGIKSFGYAWLETGATGTPRRKATITNSGVEFGTGYFNGENNNNYCIPQKIYGLKKSNISVYAFKRTA